LFLVNNALATEVDTVDLKRLQDKERKIIKELTDYIKSSGGPKVKMNSKTIYG